MFLEAPSLFVCLFYLKKAGTVSALPQGMVTAQYLSGYGIDLQTRFPVTPNGSTTLFEGTKRTAVSIWDLGFSRVNSSARQILRSASKSTETLSRQGCAKKYVFICNNIPGEFAPCRPASVVWPQFQTLPVINTGRQTSYH